MCQGSKGFDTGMCQVVRALIQVCVRVVRALLLLLLLLRRSARAGGRNCQTRSPWAERKGAVGRRNAGRAGADEDRGGGGGRASLREGLPVRVTHAPSPAAGGGLAHLCETEAGGGAGGRDQLSGDLRGPGSPCFSHSPATGEGAYFLCEGGGGWMEGGGYVWSMPLCPGSLACGQRGMRYGPL